MHSTFSSFTKASVKMNESQLFKKASYGKFYRGNAREPHVQDNLYKSGVDNENKIAVGHITNKGGKYSKPAFGASGNLLQLEVRHKTERQRLPSDQSKKRKLKKAIAKTLPEIDGIQTGLHQLSELREEEMKQLQELEAEINLLKQTLA